MVSREVAKVFSVEADEELYQEDSEVIWVYIFSGQSVWWGWNDIAPTVGV